MNLNLEETNLYGKIGAILCWYDDEDNMPFEYDAEFSESPQDVLKMQLLINKEAKKEQNRIGKCIASIPKIVNGEFESLDGDTIFSFCDALGSYPERDEILQKIYSSLNEEYGRRCKKTKGSMK